MTRPGWDEYFLNITTAIAQRGDCTRRQVGAVLVNPKTNRIVGTGYNGTAPGRAGCLDGACPRATSNVPPNTPYRDGPGACISTHAEVNAINYTTGAGVTVTGSTLYVVCLASPIDGVSMTDEYRRARVTQGPCPDCRQAIVTAGISRVVWPDQFHPRNVTWLTREPFDTAY